MFTRAFKFCLAPVSSKQTLLDRHPLHGRDNRTAPAHGCQGTATAARLTGCASQNASATAWLPPRGRNHTVPNAWLPPNCHAPK